MLACRRVLTIVSFGVIPAVLVAAMLAVAFAGSTFLYDFHGGLYDAGRDILHGVSPYRPGFLKLEAAVLRSGGKPATIDVPVYPAPALLAAVPLSVLTYKLAAVLFSMISISSLALALRLLGVRDWRCYGAAFASWPVLSGLRLGAVGPLLLLGVAVAWRWRDKASLAGAAISSVVVAKLFPWTTSIWLLATRRFRAFAVGTVLAVVLTLGAWALIDFHGMTSYPEMLSNLSLLQRSRGVSVVAGLLSMGVSPTIAQAAGLLAGATLLAISARLIGRPDGDARALGLAVVAALVASPNVWPHYFVLLFVPIALMSPIFSPLWLVPMLAWLVPVDEGTGLDVLPYLAIEAILITSLWLGRISITQVPGARGFGAERSCARL